FGLERIERRFSRVAAHNFVLTCDGSAPALPWTAVNFLSGSPLGALFFGDQSLPVGDRDLVIVGMDFTEGKKTMPVAAVVDKGCLQRRLHARHFRQVDIAS